MIPYERRQQILKFLEDHEITQIEDLCNRMRDVSESTVRRDLKYLEKEGRLALLGGGGVSLRKRTLDEPVDAKTVQHVAEKEKIAKFAADLVKDGEAIYIDAGSTPLCMLKYLKGKHVVMVTTNALVQNALKSAEISNSDIQCISVGGELKIATASIVGAMTNQMLQRYYFDKAFLGTSGISSQSGFNTPDFREVAKKRIVKEHAKNCYILADSSKYNVSTLCKIFEIGEATLITNEYNDVLKDTDNYMIV